MTARKLRVRWHRGGLAESLATTFEIATLDELKTKIKEHHPFSWSLLESGLEQLQIIYYGYDARCDWDVWMVSLRGPLAMIDRLIPPEAK